MKNRKPSKSSMNFKLLTIFFASIVLLAIILTSVSLAFIRSCFDQLYRERLSSPSRMLLAQYSYADVAPFVSALNELDGFADNSKRYLNDREYIEFIEATHSGGDYPETYDIVKRRMLDYTEELSQLKNDKYYSFSRSLVETRISTGVKHIYVIADLNIDDGYVFIYNTFYQADVGIFIVDDYGTVAPKSAYPELQTAFETGETVYVIKGMSEEGLSHSFTPIKDGYGNVVAVIGVDVNLESIRIQLNQFLVLSVIITVVITLLIMFVMFFILKRTIIQPVKSLTSISREIAKGNVRIEIPGKILERNDEMGVLGNSYESMRVTLDKLITDNRALFDAIITGDLNARGDASHFQGIFTRLIDSINDTLDVIGLYFNSIQASFVILDPAYDIVYANDNFRTTFADVSAKQLYQHLLEDDDDDYASLKAKLSALLSQGEYNCLSWFEFGETPKCFSFICNGIARDGEKSGAIFVIMDNTELVLAKDKALSANRAKSEFLSRVSHELRTPLNAILSMAKLGLNDSNIESSVSRFEKIVSSSTHLTSIINDVLEMSRMESGKIEIRNAPMDVSRLIDDCVSMFTAKAEENGNQLSSHVDPRTPERLNGDEFRIKQIILNLLSNAIKFTNDGEIRVNVECLEKTDDNCLLEFTIADTGIGMSEEFLQKVFLPFEQEDNFLSRRYEGSGLGLAISHNLVSLMGGSMRVYSKIGEGSRFVFAIQFDIAKDAMLPQADDGAAIDCVSLAGMRMLLADDIEINRAIVCEILKGTGIEIDEAVDGEDAFSRFIRSEPFHYDVIVMDIQMPNMDGYNATKAIRRSGRPDCDLPIIAMTANALKEDVDKAIESGMNDHIAKPVDFDLCVQKVKEYCTK